MKMRLKVLSNIVLLTLILLLLPGLLAAQEFSSEGADSCLKCHKSEKWGVMPIFDTKHGSLSDPDAPFSNDQCESCHGPSNEHARAKKKSEVKPARTFGKDSPISVAQQNEACLGCHMDQSAMGWIGSMHEIEDVGCASCHSVHEQHDPVFDPLAQQEVCFTCHQPNRADTFKPSGHPLRFGSMTCSDCHNVHDGNNDFLLTQDNVNDTCYTCHAEKRGPFLWEHAPVTDSCSLCHEPHGSNHPALLTKRPPLLCQQCHSATDHPGQGYPSEDMDEVPANRFLMARGCMNCHTQVHGSNHPSGSSELR